MRPRFDTRYRHAIDVVRFPSSGRRGSGRHCVTDRRPSSHHFWCRLASMTVCASLLPVRRRTNDVRLVSASRAHRVGGGDRGAPGPDRGVRAARGRSRGRGRGRGRRRGGCRGSRGRGELRFAPVHWLCRCVLRFALTVGGSRTTRLATPGAWDAATASGRPMGRDITSPRRRGRQGGAIVAAARYCNEDALAMQRMLRMRYKYNAIERMLLIPLIIPYPMSLELLLAHLFLAFLCKIPCIEAPPH